MSRIAVFLRGINLAGHNRLAMADLRTSLGEAGFSNVETLLQTGNVLLEPSGRSRRQVADEVERIIADRHGLDLTAVVREPQELRTVLASGPFLGDEENLSRLHVVFLETPVDTEAAAAIDPRRSPPDRFLVSGDVIYLHYPNGMGRSKLTLSYIEGALGVRGTARNWNTISKVSESLDADAQAE
ncbi:MAG: DUF1697 domain-containing protein [Acidimicrobiia bacterium]